MGNCSWRYPVLPEVNMVVKADRCAGIINPGSVCLGDQKVLVKASRVRNGVDGVRYAVIELQGVAITQNSALGMVLSGFSQWRYAYAA